jgi:hypothetical protein
MFSLNYNLKNAIVNLHTFQSIVAQSLGFPAFTSRLLAVDLNTKSSTWNHYKVFLPFLVQSLWNLGTTKNSSGLFLATSGLVFYSRGRDKAENTVLLLCIADHTENTTHVMTKHC